MSFTIGSLFDGSGGFPLAAFMCGGVPVWASEIEPYPIAVTKSRFPYVKHLGDVSKIKGNEIDPVDVISFGSPCQDLSVAGLRKGLKHEDNGDDETTRSGLFMEAIRIIKEMREATNGRYPTFALWENVPGAFSSNKGEDFRIVLEELIKIVEPTAVMPAVPKTGWSYADCYVGDGWSLAYRVLDAQHIRTAQRRKRIYLVLDLGGERAREVLFERESLRGYFEASRAQREGITSDVERGIIFDDCERNCVVGFDAYNHNPTGDIAKSLTAMRSDTDHIPVVFISGGFKEHNSPEAHTIGYQTEKSPTLSGTKHDASVVCYGISAYESNAMKSSNPHSGIYEAETSRTLDLNGGNPACNQGGIMVVQKVEDARCVCYDARGNGDGVVSPTITGDHNNRITDYTTIVLDRAFYNQGQNALYEPQYYEDGIVPPIVAKGPSAVAYVVDQGGGKSAANVLEDLSPTLTCTHGGEPAVAYSADIMSAYPEVGEGKVGTLDAHYSNFPGCRAGVERTMVYGTKDSQYIVRRLTPTECARLQGFEDFWGHPDKKDDFTDEEYEFWLNVRNTHAEINGKQTKNYNKKQMLSWYNKLHTDSSEYKMWGNGIALPCALYVMEGIADTFN